MSEINTINATEQAFEKDNEITLEASENVTDRKKPYELRTLCSEDIFPMLTIIRKIGIKEFKDAFSKETVESLVAMLTGGAMVNSDGTQASQESTFASIGVSFLPSILDIADILLTNIPKCENDLYKFLESLSNLSEKEIRKMNMADFFEMIVDVIKKDEFKDFFKVVSTLF